MSRLVDAAGPGDSAPGRPVQGDTTGRSVLSGRPIPDERLEAFPLAELTVEEEAAQERADRPLVEAVERAADAGVPEPPVP